MSTKEPYDVIVRLPKDMIVRMHDSNVEIPGREVWTYKQEMRDGEQHEQVGVVHSVGMKDGRHFVDVKTWRRLDKWWRQLAAKMRGDQPGETLDGWVVNVSRLPWAARDEDGAFQAMWRWDDANRKSSFLRELVVSAKTPEAAVARLVNHTGIEGTPEWEYIPYNVANDHQKQFVIQVKLENPLITNCYVACFDGQWDWVVANGVSPGAAADELRERCPALKIKDGYLLAQQGVEERHFSRAAELVNEITGLVCEETLDLFGDDEEPKKLQVVKQGNPHGV